MRKTFVGRCQTFVKITIVTGFIWVDMRKMKSNFSFSFNVLEFIDIVVTFRWGKVTVSTLYYHFLVYICNLQFMMQLQSPIYNSANRVSAMKCWFFEIWFLAQNVAFMFIIFPKRMFCVLDLLNKQNNVFFFLSKKFTCNEYDYWI